MWSFNFCPKNTIFNGSPQFSTFYYFTVLVSFKSLDVMNFHVMYFAPLIGLDVNAYIATFQRDSPSLSVFGK